jgi:uncharacterized zinc-type alcohol dehydrogenase-like protein
MLQTKGFAAKSATAPLEPHNFQRRDVGPKDILIHIDFCGVCHSDIHSVRNEWGGANYPVIPGHEIVGHITQVGSAVTKFKVGDLAGVGCMVDSCRTCHSCEQHLEQFCDKGATFTYGSPEKNMSTPTYGGYSSQVVVDQDFVLKISPKLDLASVAPLLCAGITTYSPLKHWGVKKGTKVGVVGLGGLGHMAVKLAASMGAEVTMLSTSASKEKDAKELGAHKFANTREEKTFKTFANYFDLIIDTISAEHDYNKYLGLLSIDGTMVLLGVPPTPAAVHAFSVITRRRSLAGSLIGGLKETQEMLDYCAEHNIVSDIEMIAIKDINTAYERMIKGDVRYRFVIDMKSL